MRTTIALDDDLVAKARDYTGITEKSALVPEALQSLVAREAARRLAALGGSDPNATAASTLSLSGAACRQLGWIDHFRTPDPTLIGYLGSESVLCHGFVLGELAIGSLRDRARTIAMPDKLPIPNEPEHHHVLALVENKRLFGRGLSWIDAYLLASTLITPGARLWTRDKRLMEAAKELEVAAYLPN